MLLNLFNEMRAAKVPVSVRELPRPAPWRRAFR
jgi:uncharacterized protein with von Willebrand factor type A (vWA) domain